MKKSTILLTCLLLLSTGTNTYLAAQTAVTVGTQITSESQIVSGKAYVLKTGAGSYITENSNTYDVPKTANSATDKSLYFMISNGDGTWKIRNYYTGRYWSVPVYNSNLASADVGNAGAWTLNYSNGIAYPSAPDADGTVRGIDRSDGKVVGWSTGDNANHKVYIYEVSDAMLLTPPVSVTAGWYLISWVDVGGDTTTDYTAADVAGKYVRNYATDVTVSDASYPLYLAEEPTTLTDKAASLVYYNYNAFEGNAGVSGYLRSANGHYVTQTGAASTTASSQNVLIYNSRSSYPYNSVICSALTGTRYSLVPKGKDATPYIGQTAQNKYPMVQFKRVKLSDLGLDAWTVVYQGEGQVTCSNASLQGINKVYNGGTFFFTTGTTPVAADFTADTEGLATKVDATNKRITIAPSATLTASDITIIQGNETTGKGNTQQALLRMKLTPSAAEITPTKLNLTISGIEQLSNVAIYATSIDQLHAAAASPVKVSSDETPATSLEIPLTMSQIDAGQTVYLWVTADVKSAATELTAIDAAITGITYDNWAGSSHTLDLTAAGNPDGQMRIFKQQTALWTPDHANTKYYRIPTMLNTADGGIVALTDYRHDHPYDLGKNASNGAGPHVVDVVARRSTDGGLTWGAPVTVAAGDGTNAATYGFGDPAIVRDADGTLHCLMAAGNTSYLGGMLHMGYSKSTDNGATWSAVEDILPNGSKFDKGGLSLQSAFTTGGKGVTFSNGRMAFAFLGKVSGTTNIYPLYSDDKGATWHVQPTVAYGGGDESKLEIMNDNSLLLSVRKGSYNGTAVRSYNRTTGDASGDGIATWGAAANWGSEMNANGCNADILYYNRETENAGRPDVIFHTITKAFSSFRKDLRLYMSFDQGQTWKEAFQLQPGYAAYSSMQKLANGDLAIIYEDGSIGNKDKQDCYAINYIVISSETINDKIDELYDQIHRPVVTFISQGETNGSAPWCSWTPSTGWATSFTSNANSGVTGVTVSATYTAFNRQGGYDQRVLLFQPSAAGAKNDVFTITAPDGYVIDGYTIGGYFGTSSETYSLTAADGTSVEIDKNKAAQNPPSYLTTSGLNTKSTTITLSNNNTANNNSAFITHFTVKLTDVYPITLNAVDGHSYATLYLPYAVDLGTQVKAYKIDVNGSYARPTEIGSVVPALAPVLLYSDNVVTNILATVAEEPSVDMSGNVLEGVSQTQTINGYVLNQLDGEVGFYKLQADVPLAANRAYIPAGVVSGNVKSFVFDWDELTGVDVVKDQPVNSEAIYNLAGQRVTKPRKGLYIVNGKKVSIR